VLTGPQSWLDARVVNISADGMAIECEHAFAAGASLPLLLTVPDAKDRSKFRPIQMTVKAVFHVHRGDVFRTGARIEAADDEARGLIEHWVRNG
jgi:PilZ domain